MARRRLASKLEVGKELEEASNGGIAESGTNLSSRERKQCSFATPREVFTEKKSELVTALSEVLVLEYAVLERLNVVGEATRSRDLTSRGFSSSRGDRCLGRGSPSPAKPPKQCESTESQKRNPKPSRARIVERIGESVRKLVHRPRRVQRAAS